MLGFVTAGTNCHLTALSRVLFCPPSSSTAAGHRGSASYSGETHFNLELVSSCFEGLTSIKRHRLVYQILEEEMRSPVHALSLITKTPAEAGMA